MNTSAQQMTRRPSSHRPLQQQPQRFVDRQQQQSSGDGEFQPRANSGSGGQTGRTGNGAPRGQAAG